VLAKNPYVRQVHTIEPGASGWQTALRILRRYDYSIAANPSDRTTSFTLFGGRHSVGFYFYKRQDWWKKLFLTQSNFFEQQHMVPLMLEHLSSLGIPAIPRVVMGYDEADERFVEEQLGAEDFILLHPFTRQTYKYWPAGHWARLAGLVEKKLGIRTIFTRSGFLSDEKQFQAIESAAGCKLQSFPRPFTLNQLAAAIHKCRAFVGVDTVATHIAAALEGPVVALYGPTMVDKWGPWPNGHMSKVPYARSGRVQTVQNTTVLQQSWPCIPCNKESCMLSKSTRMECLENISPETVLASLKLSLSKLA
jgi:heptosyltransferase-3